MAKPTEAALKAQFEESQRFTDKLAKWIVSQHVNQDIASIALMNLAVGAVGTTFGEEAAQEFGDMLYDFISSKMSKANVPDKQFWNLMVEKGYDKPVRF